MAFCPDMGLYGGCYYDRRQLDVLDHLVGTLLLSFAFLFLGEKKKKFFFLLFFLFLLQKSRATGLNNAIA